MKYAIPVECLVTLSIMADGPTAGAAAKAVESYWAKHYENPDEPCSIEGKYVKGSANVLPLKAVNTQSRGGTKEYKPFVHMIKETQDGEREEGNSPLG